MKTTLLFSFFIASLTAVAQDPVSAFYTPNTSGLLGGTAYTIVSSPVSLNESAAGANLTWNFNQLEEEGSSVTETVVPTVTDAALYPNSNALVHTISTFDGEDTANDIFLSLTANVASITGVNIEGVSLNYVTNNGLIGAFPLSYGYTHSDAVAGTFAAGLYSGTFSGTLTAAVDAYGTLATNIGGIPAGTTVTRLKISQELVLSFAGFPIGTLTQTTYSYYNATIAANNPVLRSMTTHVVVAALSMDETTSSIEVYQMQLLGDKDVPVKAKTVIAPNPVVNVLHLAGNETITGVTITDFSGRVVVQSKSANDIAVSHLSTGVYNVAIQSGSGTSVQKMVKQ